MSETPVNENAAPVNEDAPAPAADAAPAEAPKKDPLANVDEFGRGVVARLLAQVNEYNAKAAQVKAASGDPQGLLDSLRESYTDDPQVAKITAAIEDLDEKREQLWKRRDELLKPVVEARIAEAKSGLGNSETEAANLLKVITQGKKYLSGLYGDDVLEAFPRLVSAKASAGGGGTDGRSGQRIRGFDVFIDGTKATQTTKKDGKDVVSSNLAVAAKVIGVQTEDLREKFLAAAGSKDAKSAPDVVEFQISTGEGDERKVHDVRCVRVKTEESASESE